MMFSGVALALVVKIIFLSSLIVITTIKLVFSNPQLKVGLKLGINFV
jgi:hypothetical protein